MPKVIDAAAVFEATVLAFARHGYSAATTQEIARAAAINEATLFRRFGSKAALIEAALTHCLSRSPFARVQPGADVRADLVAIATAYAETYRAYGGAVMTLLAEVPRHPELGRVMAVLLPNLRNAAQIVAGHQAAGRLRPGDPMQMVGLLIGPVLAAGLWARTGVPLGAALPDAETVADGFLAGHGTGPRR